MHLHTFSEVHSAERPYARRCRDCDEPQVYRDPPSKTDFPYVMLFKKDDLRALLVTCLVRTGPKQFAETLQLILDVYADETVTRLLATSFTSVFRRALIFHLAQAGLSIQCFREISRLLRSRTGH